MIIRRLFLITLSFFHLISCRNSDKFEQEKLFSLLSSDDTNVTFKNTLSDQKLNILEYLYYYNGGGVATADFDNDGLIDLYFTSNEGENKLYRNTGKFKFEDMTSKAGVGCSNDWSTGVTLVDINTDGFLDLYVCQVGNYKGLKGVNKLFINNGDFTFSERANEYGLDFSGFSTQAGFFDFDQDGDLDMYLLNHSVHSTRSYGPARLRQEWDAYGGDRLYLNQSEIGLKKFKEVTHERGIYSSHIGYGLGVAFSDVNADGWPDVYVANDFHENDYLYINQKDGTFKESLEKMIAHTSRYSMGIDIGDLNGDELPEIISTDMLPYAPEIILKSAWEDTQEVSDIKKEFGYADQHVRNMLQLNRRDHFTEIAQAAGMEATDWSWSPLIFDFNNDAHADVFITNGIYKRPNDLDYIQYTSDISQNKSGLSQVARERDMIDKMPTLKIPNAAFINSGNLTFKNKSDELGLEKPSYSNGAAYSDLDNDGDLDLVVNNTNQEAFIYRNNSNFRKTGNYLSIKLIGHSDKFGLGAKIKVYANGRVWLRENFLTRGFQSSVAPVIHFGVGNTKRIDSVEVFWSHDKRQVKKEVGINSHIIISEQSFSSSPRQLIEQKKEFNTISISPSIRHQENSFKDYSVEPLIPYRLSQEGPALAVADVNADGLEDFYLGGAKGRSGTLVIQKPGGKFEEKVVGDFINDSVHEDVDAIFFDANADHFPDLYVVSGGGEFPEGNELYSDRLYMNDGAGKFNRSVLSLPRINRNGSCVRSLDFNNDGAMDLFIGVRSVPGKYGISPLSYFLRNTGSGKFELYQSLEMGMITDAACADLNHDGRSELVVVGDWITPKVYSNNGRSFVPDTTFKSFGQYFGWWRSINIADINGDGKPDILAGNMGINHRLRPTKEIPVKLFLNDFDENGQTEPLIFYPLGGKIIPFHTKSQLARQLPVINKRFNSFQSFSRIAKPEDLLPEEKINSALKFTANHFENSVFVNAGRNEFQLLDMPYELQYSSVSDWLVHDFNNDQIPDILCVGNTKNNLIQLGNPDGQSKILLIGKGKNQFELKSINSMNDFFQDIKSVEILKGGKKDFFIFNYRNNAPEIVLINDSGLD